MDQDQKQEILDATDEAIDALQNLQETAGDVTLPVLGNLVWTWEDLLQRIYDDVATANVSNETDHGTTRESAGDRRETGSGE